MDNAAIIEEKLRKLLLHDPTTASLEGLTAMGVASILDRLCRVSPSGFDPFLDVVNFHRKFQIQYIGPPRKKLDPKLNRFRDERLKEELREHLESKDPAKRFDGLLDLIYIAMGTIHLHGWDFYTGWSRVHMANMAKVRGEGHEGKYGSDGVHVVDIIKPLGWRAPRLEDLV